MSKNELDGLPVIEADETEEITVAVRADDDICRVDPSQRQNGRK
jgi:hypothetical protein